MSQKQALSEAHPEVWNLDDKELRAALKSYNKIVGPITESTRDLYRKTLATVMDKEVESSGIISSAPAKSKVSKTVKNQTSKHSKPEVEEEEEEEEDEDEEEEDEEVSDEDEQESDEESLNDSDESERAAFIRHHGSTPHSPWRSVKFMVTGFLAGIFGYFLFHQLPQQGLLVKKLMMLGCFVPLLYAIYAFYRFYSGRKDDEKQRTYEFVHKALELIQSPETPASMPILHARDTLISPTDRKNPAITKAWNHAVKFIKENESRVAVELVNIDGDDFTCWKWIGSKKL